jgi:hypothetical protein
MIKASKARDGNKSRRKRKKATSKEEEEAGSQGTRTAAIAKVEVVEEAVGVVVVVDRMTLSVETVAAEIREGEVAMIGAMTIDPIPPRTDKLRRQIFSQSKEANLKANSINREARTNTTLGQSPITKQKHSNGTSSPDKRSRLTSPSLLNMRKRRRKNFPTTSSTLIKALIVNPLTTRPFKLMTRRVKFLTTTLRKQRKIFLQGRRLNLESKTRSQGASTRKVTSQRQ